MDAVGNAFPAQAARRECARQHEALAPIGKPLRMRAAQELDERGVVDAMQGGGQGKGDHPRVHCALACQRILFPNMANATTPQDFPRCQRP